MAILQGVAEVSELISRYEIVEALYLKQSSEASRLLQRSLVNLYAAILTFLGSAYRFYTQRKAERWARSILPLGSKSIAALFVKISEEQIKVDRCTRMVKDGEDVKYQKETKDDATMILKNTNDINGRLTGIELKNEEKWSMMINLLENLNANRESNSGVADDIQHAQYADDIKWLSNIDYAAVHQEVRKDRLEGTGRWLLAKPEYQRWSSSQTSNVLWLNGILGMGKTKLISTVVDEFLGHSTQQSSSFSLAYFYCHRKQESEKNWSDPDEIFRSITRQLLTNASPERRAQALELFERRRSGISPKTTLSVDDCVEVIVSLTQDKPAVIILDALDECQPERLHEIMKAITTIVGGNNEAAKVFISSRDNVDIVNAIHQAENCYIDAADNYEDIQAFIRTEVEARRQSGRLPNTDLCSDIIGILEDGAHGMFQWVKVQLDQIPNAQTQALLKEDVLEMLTKSARTLQEGYERIHRSILESGTINKLVATGIFSWLLYGQRNLSELEFTAAVTPGPFARPGEISSRDVVKLCQGMVSFDSGIRQFRFAHLSVQEYVEKLDECTPSSAHSLIAARCLDVLSARSQSSTKQGGTSSSLLEYASIYWPVHCARVGVQHRELQTKAKIITFVFRNKNVSIPFKLWLESLDAAVKTLPELSNLRAELLNVMSANQPALHLACAFNLPEIINHVSNLQGFDLWKSHAASHSPVETALAKGHLDIIKALLPDLPAHVNRLNVEAAYQLDAAAITEPTPIHFAVLLQAAAVSDQPEVVDLLLENGARNVHGGYYGDALQAAAVCGASKTLQYLLDQSERGFDPNSSGGHHGYPLHAAANRGDLNAMEMLLAAGAEPNALGGCFGLALNAAVASDDEDAVRLLLAAGADVGTESPRNIPTLEFAIDLGRESVVAALLEEGVNMVDPATLGPKILHEAARKGLVGLIEHLLDNNFDIDFRSGSEPSGKLTPLQTAIRHGQSDAVQVLLNRGADWRVRVSNGQTSLVLACRHEAPASIVRSILEIAIQSLDSYTLQDFVDAVYQGNRTALFEATWYGSVESVELLLHYGATFKPDSENSSPLHTVVYRGHREVLKLFLELPRDERDQRGLTAAIDLRNTWNCTPLWDAVRTNNVEATALLTEEGSSVHYQQNNMYPLMRAAEKNYVGIATIFLSMSSEQAQHARFSPIESTSGGTALNVAATHGSDEVFVELLKYECRLDEGPRGSTPLHDACWAKRLKMVRAVLEMPESEKRRAKFDINAQDRDGDTALVNVIRQCQADIVKLLLEGGANLHLQNNEGETPLMACAKEGDVTIGRLLLDHAARTTGDLHRALEASDADSCFNALRYAARRGHAEFVSLLLEAGADWAGVQDGVPTHQPIYGDPQRTALMWAAQNGHTAVVRELLQAAQREGDYERIVKHLQERDSNGRTAIDLSLQTYCGVFLKDFYKVALAKVVGTPQWDGSLRAQGKMEAIVE